MGFRYDKKGVTRSNSLVDPPLQGCDLHFGLGCQLSCPPSRDTGSASIVCGGKCPRCPQAFTASTSSSPRRMVLVSSSTYLNKMCGCSSQLNSAHIVLCSSAIYCRKSGVQNKLSDLRSHLLNSPYDLEHFYSIFQYPNMQPMFH